jgi:hypothetical protein
VAAPSAGGRPVRLIIVEACDGVRVWWGRAGAWRGQRKLANLSLRQLADLTSLSNPYLSRIERGLQERAQRPVAPRSARGSRRQALAQDPVSWDQRPWPPRPHRATLEP